MGQHNIKLGGIGVGSDARSAAASMIPATYRRPHRLGLPIEAWITLIHSGNLGFLER
jgi:hypothetical protein